MYHIYIGTFFSVIILYFFNNQVITFNVLVPGASLLVVN